jgi:hypothetical protein
MARAHLAEVLGHADLERATAAAAGILSDHRSTRAAKARATKVAVQGLATLPGDWAWCSARDLCRSSVRLRRAVCEAAALGRGRQRKRLVYALACTVHPRHPRRKAIMRRVLATCSPEIEQEVVEAILARSRRMGVPAP